MRKTSVRFLALVVIAGSVAIVAHAQQEQPTIFGAVSADVVLQSSNLLECSGKFALCYYSGPSSSGPEGTPLPCTLDAKMTKGSEKMPTASCTCMQKTGTYYVLINGILNDTWYQNTVQMCGIDGSGCKSLAKLEDVEDCDKKEDKKAVEACIAKIEEFNAGLPIAPVCGSINGDTQDGVLYSTFGFQEAKQSHFGSTSCPVGLYAGCMTAPCTGANDTNSPVQCECPTFFGPFQVGEWDVEVDRKFDIECNMGSGGEKRDRGRDKDRDKVYKDFRQGDNVWSASYHPYNYTSPRRLPSQTPEK